MEELEGHVAPNPIIIKFVTMSDKQLVLQSAKNLDKSKRLSIRTVLPTHLKDKRAKLAKIAYNMRKPGDILTFIKETYNDVQLL